MNNKFSLRERIQNGDVLIGMFAKFNNCNAVEMVGLAGFDFVIFDTEHANFSRGEIENLIRTADSVGMSSIVRVQETTPEEVLHALDSGADGVQVPGITTIEQAVEVCRSSKYYPEGDRGSSMAQRSAMYGLWDKDEKYFSYANSHSAVVLHVENLEMYEKLDEVVKIPQLDVVFIGPGDLSQAIGKPGQLDDPELAGMIEQIIRKSLAAHKAVGIFCGNVASAKKYIDMGATYIALGSDVSCFGKALKGLKSQVNETLSG